MATTLLPPESFEGTGLDLDRLEQELTNIQAAPEDVGTGVVVSGDDTRVRLRAMTGQENQVYGPEGEDNVLAPLHRTNGLLFPYTPQISVSQAVDYHTIALTHSIGDIEAYNRTQSPTINVSARFTVQNQMEGAYAIAALHFLRTVSKMYFGQQDAGDENGNRAGTPPPVLIFNGYGNYMFNNLPVVLKSHNYSFDDHTDTVLIQTAGGVARLPVMFQVTMDLTVQQTPRAMRTKFNLDKFRTGELLRNSEGTGWL